jgi:hypothetical protein
VEFVDGTVERAGVLGFSVVAAGTVPGRPPAPAVPLVLEVVPLLEVLSAVPLVVVFTPLAWA